MKVRVPIENLKIGQVTDSDIYAGSSLLLAKGAQVTNQLLGVLKRRNLSFIEVSEESELASKGDGAASLNPLSKLLANAGDVYSQHNLKFAIPQEMLEEATDELEGFFNEIESGEIVDINGMRPMASMIVKQLSENPDAAIKLLDLDKFDRYTYRHSLNVGMLYAMIAQDWCDPEEEYMDQVFGALMHDLGKAKVGRDIINKKGKLTEEEWKTMRMHPVWSAEMLEEGGASPVAVSIARDHHERLDGSGYARGLSGREINKYARLAAVADVYDALTTKRSYKAKMDFGKAINIIIKDSGSFFDPKITHMFIKRVGRFPLGTFVKLSTGGVAIVVKINEHAVSCPVVSRVLDPIGIVLDQPEHLDLSKVTDITITSIVVSPEEVEA